MPAAGLSRALLRAAHAAATARRPDGPGLWRIGEGTGAAGPGGEEIVAGGTGGHGETLGSHRRRQNHDGNSSSAERGAARFRMAGITDGLSAVGHSIRPGEPFAARPLCGKLRGAGAHGDTAGGDGVHGVPRAGGRTGRDGWAPSPRTMVGGSAIAGSRRRVRRLGRFASRLGAAYMVDRRAVLLAAAGVGRNADLRATPPGEAGRRGGAAPWSPAARSLETGATGTRADFRGRSIVPASSAG